MQKYIFAALINRFYCNKFTICQVAFMLCVLGDLRLLAQNKHDFIWPFAFRFNGDFFGANILNFNTLSGNPDIYYDKYKTINYRFTCTPIADKFGNLLFSYNGLLIEDASNNVMENGNSFGDWSINDGIAEGGIILPWPLKSNHYILIHETWNYLDGLGSAGDKLYYSIIDMTKNNGLGAVVSKRNLVLSDTLDYGKVVATRHANGRDWWIIIPKYDSNIFFTFIVNPEGFYYHGKQEVGSKNRAGFGHSSFSPDGSFYAKYSSINESLGAYYDIYNFDRCAGSLSNHHQFFFSKGKTAGGVAFSPDSKILYISYFDQIYQVDLSKTPYSLGLVATFDGHISEPVPGYFAPSYFGFMRLAPDDRIYCSPTIVSSNVLHSIDKPDLIGSNCQVNQHSVLLPTMQQTVPNFPNYRLGPLDDSPCDTLDLDNNPAAWWRYEQDTLNPLWVEFRDLSYYEPVYWQWDFGDGEGSSEPHPLHIFGKAGVYNVCLKVSNVNSADTLCRTLYLGVSAQDNPVLQGQIQVTPNPFREQLTVTLSVELGSPKFQVYDELGRLVCREWLAYGITEITTLDWPTGMYFWEVGVSGEVMKNGKVVKAD